MNLFFKRLWIQLTADKRKFGLLCTMVALGLLLWARIIIISNMPRTAVADVPDDPVMQTPAPVRRDTGEAIEVELAPRPPRDPFIISTTFFPLPVVAPAIDPVRINSGSEAAEDPQQAEARRLAGFQALLDGFTLEAVMQEPALAVINGRTWEPGDFIPAVGNPNVVFEFVEVRERAVILSCEGYQFELEIPAPRGQ